MKKWALAIALFSADTAHSQDAHNGYQVLRALQQGPVAIETEADLRRFSETLSQRGYIWGFLNALAAEELICVPNGTINDDVMTAVRAYLEQNTDKLNMTAAALVGAALYRAFPCQ